MHRSRNAAASTRLAPASSSKAAAKRPAKVTKSAARAKAAPLPRSKVISRPSAPATKAAVHTAAKHANGAAKPTIEVAPKPAPNGHSPSVPPPKPVAPMRPTPSPAARATSASGYTPPPPMVSAKVNFKVGDKAVHPAHGVGEVTAINEREIGGTKQMFYDLKILDNGMKVMVPMSAAQQVGLRGIMSAKEADAILETMRAREVAVDLQPWSRRFRVYTEMIKSGSPVEVAKVLRDMNRLKFDKDLSFGERRLLDQAKSLLMKELAFAKKVSEAQLSEEVKRIFSA